MRTAASGVTAEGLAEDMAYLDKLWHHVRETSLRTKPGDIVHENVRDRRAPPTATRDDPGRAQERP